MNLGKWEANAMHRLPLRYILNVVRCNLSLFHYLEQYNLHRSVPRSCERHGVSHNINLAYLLFFSPSSPRRQPLIIFVKK